MKTKSRKLELKKIQISKLSNKESSNIVGGDNNDFCISMTNPSDPICFACIEISGSVNR